MCQYRNTPIKKSKEEIIAYKVFKLNNDNTLSSLFYNYEKRYKLKKKYRFAKWYEPFKHLKRIPLNTGHNMVSEGFHLFKHKTDAEMYLASFKDDKSFSSNSKIVKIIIPKGTRIVYGTTIFLRYGRYKVEVNSIVSEKIIIKEIL